MKHSFHGIWFPEGIQIEMQMVTHETGTVKSY